MSVTAFTMYRGYIFGVGIYWPSWTFGIEFDESGFNLCFGPLNLSIRRLTYEFVMCAIGHGDDE